MAPIFKVALCQFDPKPVAVEDNFAASESYIRSAASQGCHLVVLPEFHLTSWVPEHPDFVSACGQSLAYLSKYQSLARELNINIVPGTLCEVHPIADGGEELRNMAYFLAAGTGDICGSYQKKNLWHPERPHIAAGQDPHVAFDTPFQHPDGRPVRAGLAICWDLAFPEVFRSLVKDGAEIIIIPAWWLIDDVEEVQHVNPDAERIFLESTLTARAFENTAAIVFCNTVGMSRVTVPLLGVLGSAGFGKDEVKIVEVDLGVLQSAEEVYKIRADVSNMK